MKQRTQQQMRREQFCEWTEPDCEPDDLAFADYAADELMSDPAMVASWLYEECEKSQSMDVIRIMQDMRDGLQLTAPQAVAVIMGGSGDHVKTALFQLRELFAAGTIADAAIRAHEIEGEFDAYKQALDDAAESDRDYARWAA